MTAYVIADIDVHDQEAYRDYVALVPGTVQPYGGRFLVAGGDHQTLEGGWQPHRLVVIEFPSAATPGSGTNRRITARRWRSATGRPRAASCCLRERVSTPRLMLLRHAKSEWPDDVADSDRPLARRGRKDAPAAGRWLRATAQVPDLVLCSPARRARETWGLAQETLGADPRVVLDERIYGAAAATLLELARHTTPAIGALLIVGHEPAMRELTLTLADVEPGDQGDDQIARVRVKFPTAAIAVLEFTGTWAGVRPGQARLAAFARPSEFRSGAGGGP